MWTDPDGFIGTLAKAQGVTAASPNNITGQDLVVDGGVLKTL